MYWGQLDNDAGYDIGRFSIKYHNSYQANLWMVVEGKLNNERNYPVVLDTGTSQTIIINKTHVLENKLPVYPFDEKVNRDNDWGICNISKLNIGHITLSDWPAFYRTVYKKQGLFGADSTDFNPIIIGLPVLREFKYIVFDSLNRQAELSSDQTFEPDQPDSWSKYPLTIEEDFSGNAFLSVEIPIAGKTTELQFDTGNGRGLAVSQQWFNSATDRIGSVNLKKAKDFYPYIGMLSCRRAVIKNLQIGNRVVNDAGISVFPDDSPLVEDCDGLVGMQCFQNTVIVLDFEQNLLWVKGGP